MTDFLKRSRDDITLAVILVGLILLFGMKSDRFLTDAKLKAITSRIPSLPPAATGMTRVLIIGGMDLSVGSVMALALIDDLEKRGVCRLLAVTITKDHPQAAAFIDAVNTTAQATSEKRMKNHRTQTNPPVTVLGSLNVDWIASVPRLPKAGETIGASSLKKLFGGKGANQAIAAARQGAQVSMIGCVGDDADGRAYVRLLRDEGIRTSGIASTKQALTGTAFIGVDAAAENLIVVAAEANGQVTAAWVKKHRQTIERSSALLLQLEVPTAAVIVAIRIANAAGVPVIFNPSPFQSSFAKAKLRIDYAVVNESEAEQWFGLAPSTMKTQAVRWRAAMTQAGVDHLIVTRGADSTLCLDAVALREIPAMKVKPVDTVGAGDAFAGTLTANLAAGEPLEKALLLANCAGALATLKPGAQTASPTRSATLRALRRLR
jgi:ribokinase